ncbi:hypothetical protein, partial [Bacteroides sp.]|uniref:hypothetical protein n=1 Tax=Bacteroides sp. TaxID=29523 RepID=UPI00261D9656
MDKPLKTEGLSTLSLYYHRHHQSVPICIWGAVFLAAPMRKPCSYSITLRVGMPSFSASSIS